MNPLLRRTSALAAATLVAGALTLSPGTANAATGNTQTASAASWLSGEAVDGILQGGYDDNGTWTTTPDYGTTGDALIAFDAAGAAPSAADTMRTALTGKLASWTTGVDYGSSDVYAGSTAKALVFTQTNGGGAGDAQLLTQLEDTVQPSGRIEDTSSYGDYANTIGQAFAAKGLFAAHSAKAAHATDFLIEQQCSAGFFRLDFTTTDTTCDSQTDASPDTDVTAYAVLGLLDQRSTPAVGSAIDKALSWLESTQKADGSFGGGTSTETPNANSTGLAGWALGEAGDTVAAGKAATWVKAHQLASGPDAGAIAYDDAALAALPATGIPTTAKTQWLMATAQALPALAYLPVPAPAPAPAGPSTAHATVKVKAPHKVHAGHAVKLKVTGLKKHEKVKLKVRGKKVAKGKAKANGKYKAKVVFKGKLAKKGKAVIVAKAASGTAKTTIKVVR